MVPHPIFIIAVESKARGKERSYLTRQMAKDLLYYNTVYHLNQTSYPD